VSGSGSRSKIVALFLSGIFPGLGQLYNRQLVKGAAFVVGSGALTWLAGRGVSPEVLQEDLLRGENPLGTSVIVPVGLLLIVWIWSLIDAWRVAGR
jgi:zinc transporter ZupT